MIKIFCLTAELGTGASIPRVNSVKHLEETGYDCVVRIGTTIAGFDVEWADIVLIHRPINPVHLSLSKFVKEKGKKLWIDNDDDQLSIPMDHISYMIYNSDITKESIKGSNRLADLVTISNRQILKSYRDFNSNIVYYPCAYDERIMPPLDLSPRNKAVLWRGSASHKKSIHEFAHCFEKIDKEVEGWDFHFVGDYPWQILEKIKRNSWHCQSEYMPTEHLWDYARKLKPLIQMVVSTNDQFTKSRSNMAYLDGTIAGAVTVCRDFPHFQVPGIYKYSGVYDFSKCLLEAMKLIDDPKQTQALVGQAWQYIQRKQTFKAINVVQWGAIQSMMGESYDLRAHQ